MRGGPWLCGIGIGIAPYAAGAGGICCRGDGCCCGGGICI